MQALSQVTQREQAFVEMKYLYFFKKPLEMKGIVTYYAPDRFEKYVHKPEPSSFLVNKDKLTIHEFRQSERTIKLSDYPLIQAFVESIRSTLSGDLVTLNKFYTVSFNSQGHEWQMDLKPNDEDMQALIEKIVIHGTDIQLNTIETIEQNGDRSVMTIIASQDSSK
jgi:hypothetical protein